MIKIGRDLGIFDKGDFDLRRALTPNEKRKITATYNARQSLFDHPAEFQRVTVKNKTSKSITGAAVKIKKIGKGKTDLYIPIEKGEKAKVIRGEIVKTKGRMKETIKGAGWDLHEKARRAFEKLKPGQAISFQIGGSPKFSRFYTSAADFNAAMNYLRANNGNWNTGPNGTKGNVDPLIEHFSVVVFDNPMYSGGANGKKEKTRKKNRSH